MKIPSLVSVQWLAQALSKSKPSRPLRVVEAILGRNGNGKQATESYRKNHIPGAVCFDINECCDNLSEFPRMLPDHKQFSEYVQHLGITNDTHVIAYENNKDFGLYWSPRLWWTFRCFGHDSISVLNGGFPKWSAADLPVESIEEQPHKTNKPFKATLNKNFVRDYEAMVQNALSGGMMYPVVDAREKELFRGLQESRPVMSPGHIPHSVNVPFMEFLSPEEGTMKDPQELKEIFLRNGIDLSLPFTATCTSGVTACIVALAAHQCGCSNVSVYDGSWSEWSYRAPRDLIERG